MSASTTQFRAWALAAAPAPPTSTESTSQSEGTERSASIIAGTVTTSSCSMMRALVSARYAFTVVRKPLRRVAGTGPTAVLTGWHLAVVDGTASVTTRVSYTLSSRKSAPPRPRPLAGGATRSVRCPPRHGRVTTTMRIGPVFVTGREGIQRRPAWTRIDAGPSGLESIPWEHRPGIPRRSRKARFVTATDVSSTQPASESAEEIEALTTPHRPDDWSDLDQRAVDTIRVLAADAVQKAGNGHPGTAMALAPLAYTLFQHTMRHDPSDPSWQGRDRFVLSAGHSSLTLYLQLFLAGYGLEMRDLEELRTWDSATPGHPENSHN